MRRVLLWPLLAALGACAERESARRPDVVLVVLEAVRADRVGYLGSTEGLTPALDALARRGLAFEQAWAASSYPTQSLAALWTGRLPSLAGALGFPVATPAPEVETLPRRFRRAGYATALVSNQSALRERAFTRGFEQLEVDSEPGRWDAARVTRKALELLDEDHPAPLFLTVVYADATPPHVPDPELRARRPAPMVESWWSLGELANRLGALPEGVTEAPGFRDLVARYEAEIAGVDRALGELVSALSAAGRLEDTLLVVTSDHGTEFLDHGGLGTGWTLHEEVLHVPLVVHGPGHLAAGRVAEPVSLVDLAPSLLGLCGIHAGLELDGRALFHEGRARVPPGPVLAELRVPELLSQRACLLDGQKRVEIVSGPPPSERSAWFAGLGERLAAGRDGGPSVTGLAAPVTRVERYALGRDPGEHAPLGEPDGTGLDAILAAFLERCSTSPLATGAVRVAWPADQDAPVEASELRQIGYL